MFYFIFYVVIILSMFYRYLVYHHFIDIWFIIDLLRHGVIYRLIAIFYLHEADLDKYEKFDQLNISNYNY